MNMEIPGSDPPVSIVSGQAGLANKFFSGR
jgi:hypothetical protein